MTRKNRDWWAKPIQSDRNSSEYGHHKLGEPEKRAPHGTGLGLGLMAIAVIYLAIYWLFV